MRPLEWLNLQTKTEIRSDGVLVAEIVQLPTKGWIARELPSENWYHADVLRTRQEALRVAYAALQEAPI